jgi:hypothetical protein
MEINQYPKKIKMEVAALGAKYHLPVQGVIKH